MIEKIRKTEDEWKELLTPDQYRVMRKKGTEEPFSCNWNKKGKGAYHCVACNLPLFRSEEQFESGSGWPSYFSPISPEHIEERPDNSFGMERIEVKCARCESHLGHVFDDAPPREKGSSTRKRYCINSLALKFKPDEKI